MADCGCGASGSSSGCGRRYIRIDDVILDKKYVVRIEFLEHCFKVWYAGNCQPVHYPLKTPKSANQIAEYTLELNTCGDQVEMSTDDHSKLLNLDLEDQHPIKTIIDLQNQLDDRVKFEDIAWLKGDIVYDAKDYTYEYSGVDPKTVSVTGMTGIPTADVLFAYLMSFDGHLEDITTAVTLSEDTKIRLINKNVTLKALFNGTFYSLTVAPNNNLVYFISEQQTFFWEVGTPEGQDFFNITNKQVLDVLVSTDTQRPLSANQGKILNDKINNLPLLPQPPDDGRLYAIRKSGGIVTWVVIG